MQLNCDTLCFSCESLQDVKVNYTLTHGLCRAHIPSQDIKSLQCKYCLSNIKLIKLFERSQCSLCNKENFTVSLKCSHLACFDCVYLEKHCVECSKRDSIKLSLENFETGEEGKEGIRKICVNCGLTSGLLQFPCGHFVCTICQNSIITCSVCPDKCDGCKSSYLCQGLVCGHRMCYDCLSKTNNLCELCKSKRKRNINLKECLECSLF